ncbi:MAG: chromosome segregation protein SMC [Clostridia bacterium]|nr:chromosome segregation protein SMC [Clostridia bacterium]
MYLKSLELHGFKSFPNRTVLTFERGATVIVGPNGSGKSNISDAMRWVLGELSSRNIRGTKMEDVIFGGTDERRPMGFAEVSVTFDNTDPENRLDSAYDEVIVTRRYFRTGESEYLINRQPCRLRDIYELFMNTGVGREGYSIIGQGKIAEIISKKSDERRSIFEEAAGISKYRHRKEETERKLKQTQDNLDRVKDILSVLEARVGPLEKEAEKARKGLAIYEEKKRADVALWLYDTEQVKKDIDEAERAWRLAQHELEIIDQIMADLDAQENALYEKVQENKELSNSLTNEMIESNQRLGALNTALLTADSDYAHSAEMIEQCRIRIDELDGQIKTLTDNKSTHEEKKGEFERALAELMDKRLELLSEQQRLTDRIEEIRHALDEALDELTVEEGTSSSLQVRIGVLKSSSVNDSTKSEDIEREIAEYERREAELKAEAERCEEATADFKEQISEKEETITECNEKIASLSEEKEQISESLNALKLERDTYVHKADVLQRMNDQLEGYQESTKFVMREYKLGNLTGGKVHGPLSSLINVDKQYITAIEATLGPSISNIVVDNEEVAKSAIRALKRANAGRATFYPITAIRSSSENEEIREAKKMVGFVGRADTLVKCDDRYRSIVEWLLLRTVVFDNIDNATEAAKKLRYRVKIVTLDGQLIGSGGSFTGGSAKRDSGLLTRLAEIASLREKADAVAKKISETEEAISEITSELAEVRETLEMAEQDKELLFALSRSQFAALDSANAKYEANKNILDKLKYDYDSLVGQSSEAREEVKRLEGEYRAALERIEALRSHRTKLGAEMGELDEKCDELSSGANEIFISITEVRKDAENVQQLIDDLDLRIRELESSKSLQQIKIDDLTFKRDNIDSVKAENKAEYEALQARIEELMRLRNDADKEGDEFTIQLRNVRQNKDEKSKSRIVVHDHTVRSETKYNSLLEKQDKLGHQLLDEYEITYQQAIELEYPPVTAENRDEVAAIQTSCKNRLRALGNYNPGAIEEYAEVKVQYDELNTQYTDLTSSFEELTGIIARIESEMRTSFVSAFEAINHNFGITFKELFGGGNAELLLTDPEDVLTSGIEIKAAPPGKIIKSLALLSGGEQSFVAIALLFAILKVNPTPFCILDEIEAALDEVNVFRFGEYIKRFDDGTQFILITHRRGTMEIGDRLYGVTMPQRGISQAIELNVDEIEGKQKELLDGVL